MFVCYDKVSKPSIRAIRWRSHHPADEHHGASQQLGHLGRLFPPLRKAQVQRLASALGAEGIGQLADQTLALALSCASSRCKAGICFMARFVQRQSHCLWQLKLQSCYRSW